MSTPSKILELVKRFEEHLDAYKSGAYNETQVRREFIDPLFKELGWDIDNQGSLAEAYKDVIHEDAIRIGGFSKAPDYCFRVGGARKFFLEAKKPSIDLKEDENPAHQLRRYGWSAKLPLSILTDFEEFAVYDCRIKPLLNDKASIGRIFYCRFTDYAVKWDEIAGIFSKEAVLKGAFDKYAESAKGKKGTSTVDTAFLLEIESWRSELARNIAIRNAKLTNRQLNFAVQKTIDRIIFLRICEDRGIETYGKLQGLVNAENIYSRLFEIFERADERYNSGLFHFHSEKDVSEIPDDITPRLKIDDKILKDILKSLYPPESPYAFSVLPVEILGQVYEQFLGQVIHLTDGHRAKIEEKPEVKKAGGVYYTPAYIVNYIVKNTVGKLLESKTPKQVSKLKVLDPACGSGSFLIGAYQYLLDWHRDWYVKDGTEKWTRGKQPVLYAHGANDWRLTTSEKKKILLNNIFGVDIDSQAVEVTKLSLLLKVLEGESGEVLNKQLQLFHERVLPDLANNIKCGNSLIGSDFYSAQQLDLFNDEERLRINAFDWSREFSEIMENGGFDAVIGNPPYIRIQAMKEWAPQEVEFYKKRYKSAESGNYDIYVVFVEKAVDLLQLSGRMGFILPHKFFNAQYGEGLRGIISKGGYLSHVVHFGDQQIFSGATTYTCLLFLEKAGVSECRFVKAADLGAWRAERKAIEGAIAASTIIEKEWNFTVGAGADVLLRIHAIPSKCGDVAHIFQGLVTGADKVFVVSEKANIEPGLTKPFLLTGDLGAYLSPMPSAKIIFPYELKDGKAEKISADILKKKYPKGWDYLCAHREELMNREHGKWKHESWFVFGRSQNLTQMETEKLIIQVTAREPTVLFDDTGLYMTGGGSGPFYGVRSRNSMLPIKYLLGIMNSNLFGWIVKAQSTNLRGGYIKFSKQYIETVPIVLPQVAGVENVRAIIAEVDKIIHSRKQFVATSSPHEKTVLQRQIDTTDREIDQLVYKLYGLTADEIKIVEGATK